MAKPITIPNTFASATSAIPLAQLDQDFSTLANSTNDLATYSNYVADTGAADAFIANYPANTNTSSLTTGLRLQFKAANANTGASTLNVQVNGASIGTASIRLTDGSALPANTIIAGALVDVMYDGTNFQIMNDPSGGQEIISNLTLSGNLTVAGTSTFTGNVTGNVVNTTTSTITNLTSSNVTITGGSIDNISITNLTSLTVDGNTTLGDASGDTLTITGTTVTTPNGLNFDSNTFVIDAANNRVGIGVSSPDDILDIQTPSTNYSIRIRASASNFALMRFVNNANNNTDAILGTPAANTLAFYTNSFNERMRITSTGAVGIGTSSPAQALHVVSAQTQALFEGSNQGSITIRKAGTNGIALFSNAAGTLAIYDNDAAATRLTLNSAGNLGLGVTPSDWGATYRAVQSGNGAAFSGRTNINAAYVSSNFFSNSAGAATYINTDFATLYAQTSGQHIWYNAASGTAGNTITFTQAMTLDASGRLSVGATTNIGGNTIESVANIGVYRFTAADSGPFINIGKSRSATTGTNTIVQNGDQLGTIAFYGANGTGYTEASYIRSIVNGTPGASNDMPGALLFATTADGAGSATERMRIDSSGNVGIGTSSPTQEVEVRKDQASGTLVQVTNKTASSAATAGIKIENSTSDNATVELWDSGSVGAAAAYGLNLINAGAGGVNLLANNGSGTIKFATGGTTERMRITSAGLVGIGTTTPGEVLQVNGKAQATTFYGGNLLTCAVVNTWYKVQDGYFGLYVFRDSSLGGNAALLYDGSTGATIFSSSIANFEGRNNAGNLEVRVTANAPRNLHWACLSTVSG